MSLIHDYYVSLINTFPNEVARRALNGKLNTDRYDIFFVRPEAYVSVSREYVYADGLWRMKFKQGITQPYYANEYTIIHEVKTYKPDVTEIYQKYNKFLQRNRWLFIWADGFIEPDNGAIYRGQVMIVTDGGVSIDRRSYRESYYRAKRMGYVRLFGLDLLDQVAEETGGAGKLINHILSHTKRVI